MKLEQSWSVTKDFFSLVSAVLLSQLDRSRHRLAPLSRLILESLAWEFERKRRLVEISEPHIYSYRSSSITKPMADLVPSRATSMLMVFTTL